MLLIFWIYHYAGEVQWGIMQLRLRISQLFDCQPQVKKRLEIGKMSTCPQTQRKQYENVDKRMRQEASSVSIHHDTRPWKNLQLLRTLRLQRVIYGKRSHSADQWRDMVRAWRWSRLEYDPKTTTVQPVIWLESIIFIGSVIFSHIRINDGTKCLLATETNHWDVPKPNTHVPLS